MAKLNVPSPPVVFLTITKLPGGTYTIGGTSPNYATFSAAASDLVTRGIAGAVTFNARAGTYSEQVNLPAIAGSSSANTITFQSESGVKTDVTLRFTQTDANNTSNYVMWLRGTRHVRLLNMMLVSYGLNVSYRTVVEVSNTAGDVVIQGDSLTGWAGGGQNLSLISGTSANGSSITDNLTIMGNRFGPAGYAVYLVGSASTETVVKGNTVTNTAGTGGIYLSGHMAPVVDSNSVVCLNDGIDLYGCTSSTSVQKNRVVSTNGGTGIQMYACNGDILDYGLVANNFVTLQGTSNGTGLYAASCTYQNFFNNTINVASGNTSTAMNVSSGGNLSVDDNILINGSGGYAYYVTSASSLVSSNYNDLRTTGSTLAYWVSAAQANLAALQAAGGKDSNSVTEPVTFVSATDLHLSGASIGDRALRGTPLAQVTVDIDGYPRSSTAPYMGANEAAVPLAVNDHKPGENGTPGQAPVVFRLFQNYPNPFNPSTTLKFTVEKQAVTTLDVFDILGRHVATLFDERAEPGQFYSIRFDGTGLASGEYFIRLRSGNRVDMKKIMLLK